ncbi:MAG: tetratricopeptide repeat protein, partial [Burkholderiaceae bacterium]
MTASQVRQQARSWLRRFFSLVMGLVITGTVAAASATPASLPPPPSPQEIAKPCIEALLTLNGRILEATDYASALEEMADVANRFVDLPSQDPNAALVCLQAHGRILMGLREHARGVQTYRKAVAIALAVYGPDDDPTWTFQQNLAVALHGLHRDDEAVALLTTVAKEREDYVGGPEQHRLAITLSNLAMAQSELGHLTAARHSSERAMQLAPFVDDEHDQRSLQLRYNHALVLDRAGARLEAQRLLEKVIDAHKRRNASGEALDALIALAASVFDTGRFEESERRYVEAYRIASEHLPKQHLTRAEVLSSWCRVLSTLRRWSDAVMRCEQADQLFRGRAANNNEVLLNNINLAIALDGIGQAERAYSLLNTTVADMANRTDVPLRARLEAKRARAVMAVNQGRIAEGVVNFEAVLDEQRRHLPPDHPERRLTEREYGVLLGLTGRTSEAERILREHAVTVERQLTDYRGDLHAEIGLFRRQASTQMFLAKLLIEQGRCEEALDWIEATKARNLVRRIRAGGRDATDPEQRIEADSLRKQQARLLIDRAQAVGDGARQSVIDAGLRDVGSRLSALTSSLDDTMPEALSATQSLQRRGIRPSEAILSLAVVDDEIVAVNVTPQSGFRCRSLGEWKDLPSTVNALQALHSATGGLPGLMMQTPSMPARRLLRHAARQYSLMARSEPIPPNAEPITDATRIEADIGSQLLGWAFDSQNWPDRILLSADGALQLISWDALIVQGRRVIDRSIVVNVPTL